MQRESNGEYDTSKKRVEEGRNTERKEYSERQEGGDKKGF